MILRDELARYINTLLACDSFNDYAPNGLQVEGIQQINKICTAVTASLHTIEQAIALNAEALLVHHGYFWRGEDAILTGMKRERICQLLMNNINLFAYHLPLDCHLELGNNACISKLLPLVSVKTHVASKTNNLLWTGSFPQPLSAHQLLSHLASIFNREPLHIPGHHRAIKKIAWCSGGAQDYIVEAHDLGADAYLSGEISERTYYQAKELKIDYFACGHHATERGGIQALGEHLSSYFGLEHHFIDSENPV